MCACACAHYEVRASVVRWSLRESLRTVALDALLDDAAEDELVDKNLPALLVGLGGPCFVDGDGPPRWGYGHLHPRSDLIIVYIAAYMSRAPVLPPHRPVFHSAPFDGSCRRRSSISNQ